jgi:hypothetical protein
MPFNIFINEGTEFTLSYKLNITKSGICKSLLKTHFGQFHPDNEAIL